MILDIENIVAEASNLSKTRQDLAIALHDYVRDTIEFGFTPYFDHASVQKTLALRTGHCNPQARLMVALFRQAGFEARFKPVTITNAVLRGVVATPPRLSHVFTEIKLGGRWVRLDSYIADPKLRRNAVHRLKTKSKELGYGCHVSATGVWDGENDSYSQIAEPHLIVAEHPPVENLEDFYRSDAYLHKVDPFTLSSILGLGRVFPKSVMKIWNRRVGLIRDSPSS